MIWEITPSTVMIHPSNEIAKNTQEVLLDNKRTVYPQTTLRKWLVLLILVWIRRSNIKSKIQITASVAVEIG